MAMQLALCRRVPGTMIHGVEPIFGPTLHRGSLQAMREHDRENRPPKLSSGRQLPATVDERHDFIVESPWGRSLRAADVARVVAAMSIRDVSAGAYVIRKGRPVA